MKRTALLAAATVAVTLAAGACSRGGSKAASAGGATTSTTAAISTTATSAAEPPTSTSPSPVTSPNAPEVNPAGDIPDNQVFVAFSPPSGGFTVKVPEGWARVEVTGAVTFTDKLNSIRIETTSAAAAPTARSAQQDELPPIMAAATNFRPGKVSLVTRKAGAAVLITYGADGAADPVTGKVVHDAVERYEFWKGGREAILTLSGPQGADNVDPWRIVTDSFVWR